MTNTDNRLLANAVRHLIEGCIGGRVIPNQRGFVGGRSLTTNLVYVDEAMAQAACSGHDGGAFFFDFA